MNERIDTALRRFAAVDTGQVRVEALGGRVTLRGSVRSCGEQDAVVRTARAAPADSDTVNELVVTPDPRSPPARVVEHRGGW